MDFIPNEKKFIFTLLDTLLLLGAIACIVTIDRGQWILSNPAFYQTGDESLIGSGLIMDTSLTSGVIGSAGAETPLIPQTGAIERAGAMVRAGAIERATTDCLTGSKSQAWHSTYRSLTIFHNVDQELVPQKGVTVAKVRCEG